MSPLLKASLPFVLLLVALLGGPGRAALAQSYGGPKTGIVDETGSQVFGPTKPGYIQGTINTSAGTATLVPLDIASITTGGTPVDALSAGHAKHGGTLITANAAGMCVDQQTTAGVATGTPSTTMCVAANQPFNLWPSAHAVSVNSTVSSVTLGGEGSN